MRGYSICYTINIKNVGVIFCIFALKTKPSNQNSHITTCPECQMKHTYMYYFGILFHCRFMGCYCNGSTKHKSGPDNRIFKSFCLRRKNDFFRRSKQPNANSRHQYPQVCGKYFNPGKKDSRHTSANFITMLVTRAKVRH